MTEWEYRKIDLSQQRPRSDDLDMLNDAGADGWELVGITSNNVAYLKRLVGRPASAPATDIKSFAPAGADAHASANPEEGQAHEVRVKYRDPQTNETWTGRGRMANWLKRKQEAGEDIEEYLV